MQSRIYKILLIGSSESIATSLCDLSPQLIDREFFFKNINTSGTFTVSFAVNNDSQYEITCLAITNSKTNIARYCKDANLCILIDEKKLPKQVVVDLALALPKEVELARYSTHCFTEERTWFWKAIQLLLEKKIIFATSTMNDLVDSDEIDPLSIYASSSNSMPLANEPRRILIVGNEESVKNYIDEMFSMWTSQNSIASSRSHYLAAIDQLNTGNLLGSAHVHTQLDKNCFYEFWFVSLAQEFHKNLQSHLQKINPDVCVMVDKSLLTDVELRQFAHASIDLDFPITCYYTSLYTKSVTHEQEFSKFQQFLKSYYTDEIDQNIIVAAENFKITNWPIKYPKNKFVDRLLGYKSTSQPTDIRLSYLSIENFWEQTKKLAKQAYASFSLASQAKFFKSLTSHNSGESKEQLDNSAQPYPHSMLK